MTFRPADFINARMDRLADLLTKIAMRRIFVNKEAVEQVKATIDRAGELAAGGHAKAAALAFALARELTVSLADQSALDGVVSRNFAQYEREREAYRGTIRQKSGEARPLTIFADSLGLPRPAAVLQTAENITYSEVLAEQLKGRRIDSYCQRFATTADVVNLLKSNPDIARDSDVLLHIGLNDCANRMFLERERLALDFLPAEIKDAVVNFSQRNRRSILRYLSPRHYVDPVEFQMNLDRIVDALKERGAGKIMLSTIILVPAKNWPGTLGVNRNFSNYNLEIMKATERHGVDLVEIDRAVWAEMGNDPLTSDGMHLSPAGHRIMAGLITAIVS